MLTAAATSYQRNLSVEDDWVAVKESPFTDHDTFSLPAVAVDWNSSQATFNVTLLSINGEKSEERLWSDSFSISKIRRRHIELCLVHPDLKKHLPALPQESQGIWGYFQWIRVSPKLCKKLEEYITEAFNICGWRVFSSVFFGEPSFLEADYTLSGLELKRNEYAKDVKQILQNFELHVEERPLEGCTTYDLFKWYDKVDDLLVKVNETERKLLEFDCEPYEELRDIAQKERSECATMLNQHSMTASTFQDGAQNFSQWEEQYVESVEKINAFRMMYFKTTLCRSQNIVKMLKEDFSKFPESSDKKESVVVRREQIEIEILKIEIKVLNCRNQKNILIRDKLRQDTVTLDEDLGMVEALNDKEIQFYQKQCEILGIENELLGKNESIVRLEMKRPKSKEDEEKLRKNLSTFLRKKAALRNKRKACEAEVKKLTTKELQKQEKQIAHHAVQMKIEQRRENEEQKRETRVEERQRTLLRLKDYKKKYTKPSPVKPPRYQAPSTRKKSTSSSSSAPASCPPKKNVVPKSQDATSNTQMLPRKPKATSCDLPKDPSSEDRSPEEGTNVPPSTVSPGSTFSPPIPRAPLPPGPPPPPGLPPPPPPPGLPPPPPPGLPPPPPPPPPPIASPLLSSGVLNGGTSLAQDIQAKKQHLNHANASSSLSQPSSLSEETVNLEAILLARNRLKKQSNNATEVKGFPSGNDLTRAIQSVKLKKVVNDKKPADLSPDGAEFLKKALERMNRFTTLSDSEEEENEHELEQQW